MKVNLDALIAREDFEIGPSGEDPDKPVFILPELQDKRHSFKSLRKPNFQRSTSDWSPRQIVDLVKSFVDRDLIPAIIVWKSASGYHFIMDGAHRLSAIIAWVNDDYGFGEISRRVSGIEKISKAVRLADDETRRLIRD